MKNTLYTRTRLIAIISIILVFSFAFTSIISFNVTRETVNKGTKDEILPLVSNNIYSEIQQILLNPINNSSLMANDEFLINWVANGETDTDEVIRYLKRIRDEYHYFSAFFVSDRTRNYYYYDGILKTISPDNDHDVWYYNFINKDIPYKLDVDTDEATAGTITIFINHRLEDNDGKLLGVTGVGLKMESVGQMLSAYQEKYGHLIYMIDSDGVIQIHPEINLVKKQNIRDLPGIGSVSTEILANKTDTQIYEIKNRDHITLASSRYFPNLEWFLIVEEDPSDSLKPAQNHLIGNLIIGLVVTIVVIVLIALTINLFHSKIEALATTDELTGINNRRKAEEVFLHEIAFTRRYGQPFSILMIDIDTFKSVNDQYGHLVGDRYLKLLTEALQDELREVDTISRWGGEEFLALLHQTDAGQAEIVARRILDRVSSLECRAENEAFTRSVSIGIATAPEGKVTVDEMIALADRALYQAKAEGGNRAHFTPDANQG